MLTLPRKRIQSVICQVESYPVDILRAENVVIGVAPLHVQAQVLKTRNTVYDGYVELGKKLRRLRIAPSVVNTWLATLLAGLSY